MDYSENHHLSKGIHMSPIAMFIVAAAVYIMLNAIFNSNKKDKK